MIPKFFRGSKQNIENHAYEDGNLYFCTEDGTIFLDYKTPSSTQVFRKQFTIPLLSDEDSVGYVTSAEKVSWNNTTNKLNNNSTTWTNAATKVNSNSSSWDNTTTTVNNNSTNWNKINNLTVKDYKNIRIDSANWENEYGTEWAKCSASVSGLKETDFPIVDLDIDGESVSRVEKLYKEFSKVIKAKSFGNQITLYAKNSDYPKKSFNLKIKVISMV